MIYPITAPGVYNVPERDYHGKEICAGPSISSSGLRKMDCPLKYWYTSPLNPNKPDDCEANHFTLGRAAHDLVLDGVGWPDRYHVLPEGFTKAASKKFAAEIEALEAAEQAGKTPLRHADYVTVLAMAEELKRHPISKALGRGKAEQTLVWQDDQTGVWLRCRPDFLPDAKVNIPDYKTTTSAHPDDFARDVATYGYHQQAALYLDGIAAIFGQAERQFYFIVQEKTAPYLVQPFALDFEAVQWGRRLNRKAINVFAECVRTNNWPGYASDFVTVSLPKWELTKLEGSF